MLGKIIIIIFLFAIIYSLGSAFYFMVKDDSDSTRGVRSLSWRIGLSMVFFVFLVIAMKTGWIKPHPITPDFINKPATENNAE